MAAACRIISLRMARVDAAVPFYGSPPAPADAASGTQHGFNNDTTPRYNKEAAALAWQRTMEFFNKHLGR
jgi:dienelactone hydrolase